MAKFKVQHEGKDLELDIPGAVPQDQLAKDYVAKAVHDHELARTRTELEGKLKGLKSPDDLLKDDEFRERATTTWGLKGKGGDPDQLKALRVEWEKQALEPVVTERDSLRSENEGLLVERLHREILEAAAQIGVKKIHLTPPKAGGSPPIVTMFESLFGFDAATRGWYLMMGDEKFAPSIKGTQQRPYKGVLEVFQEQSADKEWAAEFLADQRQRGAGVQGAGGESGGGPDVYLTQEQAEDHAVYQAAREQAKKQGGQVRVKPAG